MGKKSVDIAVYKNILQKNTALFRGQQNSELFTVREIENSVVILSVTFGNGTVVQGIA